MDNLFHQFKSSCKRNVFFLLMLTMFLSYSVEIKSQDIDSSNGSEWVGYVPILVNGSKCDCWHNNTAGGPNMWDGGSFYVCEVNSSTVKEIANLSDIITLELLLTEGIRYNSNTKAYDAYDYSDKPIYIRLDVNKLNFPNLEEFVFPETFAGFVYQGDAFQYSNIKRVDLSRVHEITQWKFENTERLESVHIYHKIAPEEKVTLNNQWGQNGNGFSYYREFKNSGISSLTLSNEVTVIPAECFETCNNLKTVTGIENVKKIGWYAFYGDPIESLDLSNADSIGYGAFAKTKLKGELILNANFVGYQAFYNCPSLEKVTINKNMGTDNEIHQGNTNYVSMYNFYYCSGLKTVVLGENVTSLPYGCFMSCSSLTDINLDNITTIGSSAFSSCSSLVIDNLDWTDKTMTIGSYSFYGTTLKFVHINSGTVLNKTPDVSASANRSMFRGIKNSNIYIEDSDPTRYNKYDLIGEMGNYDSSDGWHSSYVPRTYSNGQYVYGDPTEVSANNMPTNYIYVPAASLQTWRTAEGWSEIADRILPYPPRYVLVDNKQVTDGVVYEEDATNQTLTLTSIGSNTGAKLEIPGSFPDGYTVTGIGKTGETGICQGNTDFTQVVLPNSLTTIGDDAFNGCTNLAAINLDSVKVYGDNALKGCSSLNVHLDLRHATAIGQEAFANCALKSAWIGQATGLGMFSTPATPLNVYVFEEDPSKVSGTNVTTGLDTKSVVYVVCRNITSSEINKNPLDAFHQDAEWGEPDAWKFVYPMLHKGNAIEREKTYTTFCFDKPLDFRGTNAEGTNYNVVGSDSWQLYYNDPMTYPEKLADRYANDDLELRGMLQFYLQPENNTSGFIDNRIEALAVTGFQYNYGVGTVESGTIATGPAGIRPAGTGVLVHWHPDTEFHGGTGLTEYYPIPPVRDASGNRMTEEAFREFFTSCTDKIRTGTYENNTGLVNSGGRNLDRLEEGDEDGQYKDNYEGGTTTYNTTTGTYTGSGYDNLMVGNTVRKDSIFYNPWYYAYATTGETGEYVWENNKHVIDYNNKEFDLRYKQFGLNPSCYFRRFHKKDEYGRETGSFMRAYRAFLRLPLTITGEDTGDSSSPYMVNALFTIGGSLDETTGISDPLNDKVEIRNDKWYSLDGRMLNGKPTQRGIYINNGKKIVIK